MRSHHAQRLAKPIFKIDSIRMDCLSCDEILAHPLINS